MKKQILMHHGIKGQQWGVKHGPPYPIQKGSGVTIRMGTTFGRLSVHDESVSKGHAYVNYLKSDIDHYKGFFGLRLKAINKGADVYSIKLTAKKDMKSPSLNERKQTFMDLYKNDPKIAKQLAKYYKENGHKILPKVFYEKRFKNMNEQDLQNKGYETFVRSIGGNEYTREEYFKALTKKGYDFVSDDMDGQYLLKYGREPSIIIDREASVRYEGQDKVPVSEMFKNFNPRKLKVKV